MNFFERQENARKLSFYLLFLFIIALAITSFSLGYGLQIVDKVFLNNENIFQHYKIYGAFPPGFISLANKTTSVFAAILLTITLVRSLKMAKGKNLMRLLGGVEILPSTQIPEEKRLLNIVEEMSIASGVPIPGVFVLRNETSINALAAGDTSQDHAIGVTQGALEQLPRDEMQAVIAHEFSHLLNGDMKLNSDLAGAISGIVLFREFGKFILETTRKSRSRKGSGQLLILGLFFWLIGSVGAFIAKLIQMAISRQREHLADASSVQFTRNPQALAKALARIKTISGSLIHSSQSIHFSHFFFANPEKSDFFSSHPSLQERIQHLDPHFNLEDFVTKVIKQDKLENKKEIEVGIEAGAGAWTAVTTGTAVSTGTAMITGAAVETVIENKEPIGSKILQSAAASIAAIPLYFKTSIPKPAVSQAVILGFLLSYQSKETSDKIFDFIEDAESISWGRKSFEFCKNNLEQGTTLFLLALRTCSTLPFEERKKFFFMLNKILLIDQKIVLAEAMQLALIHFHLNLQKENSSPILSSFPVKDARQRFMDLFKSGGQGAPVQWDLFLDDVRVLRRLAGKLNQEFFQELVSTINNQSIEADVKKEFIRFASMLFEIPALQN